MDKKELYRKFNVLFESYRICKYLCGPNTTVIPQEKLNSFCAEVEAAVDRLPQQEKEIIQKRFMVDDYVFDKDVYEKLQITDKAYDKRKFAALNSISNLLK